MKQVSKREFQLNSSKYLSELPFELTSYGKVVARVIPPNEAEINVPTVTTKDSTNVITLLNELITIAKDNSQALLYIEEYVAFAKARVNKKPIEKALNNVTTNNKSEAKTSNPPTVTTQSYLCNPPDGACNSNVTKQYEIKYMDEEDNQKKEVRWLCGLHATKAKHRDIMITQISDLYGNPAS